MILFMANFSQIANKTRINNLSSDNAMLAHDLFLFGWGRPDICCVSVLHSWPYFYAFCSVLMTRVFKYRPLVNKSHMRQ